MPKNLVSKSSKNKNIKNNEQTINFFAELPPELVLKTVDNMDMQSLKAILTTDNDISVFLKDHLLNLNITEINSPVTKYAANLQFREGLKEYTKLKMQSTLIMDEQSQEFKDVKKNIRKQYKKLVKLFKIGVKIDPLIKDLNETLGKQFINAHEKSIFLINNVFSVAAKKQNHEEDINNIKENPLYINYKSQKNGDSILHTAVRLNEFELVKKAVESGIDVNLQNNNGVTPVYLAALEGNLDILNYLIEKGADVNLFNSNNITPLLVAAEADGIDREGRKAIIKKLLDSKVDVTARDIFGDNILHIISKSGRFYLLPTILPYLKNVEMFNVKGCERHDKECKKLLIKYVIKNENRLSAETAKQILDLCVENKEEANKFAKTCKKKNLNYEKSMRLKYMLNKAKTGIDPVHLPH